MESSLKNLVKEVYKNTNEDGNFKFTGNSRNKSNTSQSIKIKKNKNNNDNNDNNYEGPLNGKSFATRIKDIKEVATSSSSMSISTIILIFLFLLITISIGLVYNYYEDIMTFLKNYFHDDTTEQELKSQLSSANTSTQKLQSEIGTLKKELENKKSENKNNEKKTYSKLSNKEKKLYSQDQFVKEHGFCYVGEDNNHRHCVEVYNGDICESGDVYKRIDKCLLPNKFA